MSDTYKWSSSRFMSSKTNELVLSVEQDPKHFRAEKYLIFPTQSSCSLRLGLGIKMEMLLGYNGNYCDVSLGGQGFYQ